MTRSAKELNINICSKGYKLKKKKKTPVMFEIKLMMKCFSELDKINSTILKAV